MGSSESTLVKMPHYWNSHVQLYFDMCEVSFKALYNLGSVPPCTGGGGGVGRGTFLFTKDYIMLHI